MSKKEKLLASVQKNLKKKALPRAAKDLAKVVEMDPNDMRSRQKLGELYGKTGKASLAYEQYDVVARYFAGNGFYLKAIAIYRQMQRLDPNQMIVHARLAELNEKQGLVGNAMSEYRQLVAHYEKTGNQEELTGTLEKMLELDPASLNLQLRLAEILASAGKGTEGREYLESALQSLKGKQDYDRVLMLYKKFLPLFPGDDDLQRGLALTLLEKGETEKGLELLQQLLREHPDDPELLRTLAGVYSDQGDLNNARLTYQHLLKLDPVNLVIREALVRCCLAGQQNEQALAELEEWKESFQKAGKVEMLKDLYEELSEALPGDRTVRQTLDSIYELTGDGDKLLDFMASDAEDDSGVAEEVAVSDALLQTAEGDDDDELVIDLNEFEMEADDLDEIDLEPLDEEDSADAQEADQEVIDLVDADSLQIEAIEEDSLDLNLDFGDEEQNPVPGRDLKAELEEAEFYLQQGLFDEAERVCHGLLQQNPEDEECRRKLGEIRERREVSGKDADASRELKELATDVLEDGFSDMALDSLDTILGKDAVELDDLLDISVESPVFRTDVDDQIAADDMESHYNLGIAYREMGLYDDAISEFEKARMDPARFIDCQTLKGLCYADKGDLEKSEESYRAALSSAEIDQAQRLSLHYELGLLFERFDKPAEALANYRTVADADSKFRDVAEKIAALGSPAGATGPGAEKDRISFL